MVWPIKRRFKALQGDIRLLVRETCRQACLEKGVDFIRDVLSSDHVDMFVSAPPKLAVSELVRLMKGRSSQKAQREFPRLKQRYCGSWFWGRGNFSTTNCTKLQVI
ncbi:MULTISPECIES: IS200/IS605 family transposase [unclassified Roseovarius]|uniref:IS200/IS605 family transposase n=1 Tax=unclassified Roseovarius TaxID=2614913 RepID=UPI00273E8B9C|nr:MULTISPECIES: IS200/IS605 family transposase [unclassified Roseovarius]